MFTRAEPDKSIGFLHVNVHAIQAMKSFTSKYCKTPDGTSLRPLHAMPEGFENGGFTLKTNQMFSVHTTPEEFKNATIAGHFLIFVCVKLRQENIVIILTP